MTSFKLGDIVPNPFRNIERYPIDRAKVEALKDSINRTSFWDNVVARVAPKGKAEIAYGHHRLVALRELYPPDHKIDLIARVLDDEAMLHIMADENMQEWTHSAPVVVETVRAVRDYLVDLAPAPKRRGSNGTKPVTTADVVEFLGWPTGRVEDALRILSAEDEGILAPEDTKDLGIEQATVMRAHVSRIKDPVVRKAAISRVRAGLDSGDIGKRGISTVVAEVRAEARGDTTRPVVPSEVVSHLIRDIDAYWRTAVQVGGKPITRTELISLIAANRNTLQMELSVRNWADQLADTLDEMATEATRLAELLRAEQAVEIGA